AALAAWLDLLAETARTDYALALQVARMRGLVKGYGDTHEHGRAKLDRLVAVLPRLRTQADAATLLDRLIKAAQADEGGEARGTAIGELIPASSSSPAPSAAMRVS